MMKSFRASKTLVLALGLGLCMVQQAVAEEDDPPGRVARLSYSQGSVSFEPAGTEDWWDAMLNRPITTGDRLWIDKGAHAELDIGTAAIRLSGQTGFSFLDLTDSVVQIQLTEGVISVHLRDLGDDETFEIDAPNLALSLLRPGDYRVEVNEAGDTTIVSVRSGQGEVTGGGQAFTVRSDQRAAFIGTDQLQSFIDNAGDDDDFDRWCSDRDKREEHSVSARYVSRDVIGYQDLDEYGEWRNVAEYGAIWVPFSVAADWAPYRYGSWTWISPWGWTWLDEAPWGFAPFHYGRWTMVGGVWGWCPGPAVVAGVVRRPIYAPALVAWVGGPHVSIGVNFGAGGDGIAWFPLAPREVYVPPYRVSRTYVTNVNITNTTVNNINITNLNDSTQVSNVRYANRTAVTATSRRAFAAAEPVARNIVRVDQAQLAHAQVTTNVGVVPQQKSVVGAAPPATVRPPVAVLTRSVVARRAPPPVPIAFAKQQQTLQANGGRPLGRREAERLEPQRTQAAAPVRVERPAGKPVPVETVARPQSGPPNGPGAQPAPRPLPHDRPASGQETQAPQERSPSPPPLRPNRPPRWSDKPPTAESNAPANSRDANRQDRPDQPARSPAEDRLDQMHQQEQQRLLQQQEQQRQQLEQKHQQQGQKNDRRAENQQQLMEHQKLQQQQELQRRQLEQKQHQERQKLQQQEAKQRKEKPKQKPEGPKRDRPSEQ